MGIVISTHLPPPVMIESTEVLKWVTHILCWSWAIYFSAAASSENDHGSMNLASNTASVPSTIPSRVAAIQSMAECLTLRWTSVTRRPVLRSYQVRLSSSVAAPSCTMRFPEKVLRFGLASFLAPEANQGRFVAAHNDPRVRAADEKAAILVGFSPPVRLHIFLQIKKWRLLASRFGLIQTGRYELYRTVLNMST